MASPSNTNTGGNATDEAKPETAPNPAGSPHDSSNAGAAENPPNNLKPVELKEGSSPLLSKEPIPNKQCYRIPSYASWFSWDKIHSTERRFLIEFFDGKSPSKTPKVYKEYRDFIINKFLENPQAKITYTQVRRMLVGDVNSIRRVFDFLENWGLINYQVASKHHLKSANAAAASSVTPAKAVGACDRPLSATSAVVDRASKQPGRARVFCKHCRVECTNSRYDCLKEEVSLKSANEGMPEEPGSSSGANNGNAEEQKTSGEDQQKEIMTMVTENLKDDKNEEQTELTGNKDQMLNKSDKLLRCPRCDSLGTKFCYYNNYKMNQPRHFCKSCQRYWTAGGTMRNVPVGAGRRKNKHSALDYWHMMRSDGFVIETADDPDAAHCQAGFVLCPKCFADGNYGLGLSASDFRQVVLKERASQKGNDKWTDQDTLLLLEAILLYGDDWKRVAQHVRTKNEADCVTKFIQLPFGEQFNGNVGTVGSERRLSNVKGENMVTELLSSPKNVSTHHQKDAIYDEKHTTDDVSGPPLKRRHLTPLADASNPIMAQVAFLSGMVGSRPAEAAARAAVAALCEEDPCATQIASTQETKSMNQKNRSTASGLEGVRKDSELETTKKELHGGTDQTANDGEFYQSADNMVSVTPERRAAAATDLGAAAIRAKHLADQEDRDIEHLLSTIMETQMKRLQDKIQHFEELDFIMDKERSQVEQIKELLVADRLRLLQQTVNSEFSVSREKGVG